MDKWDALAEQLWDLISCYGAGTVGISKFLREAWEKEQAEVIKDAERWRYGDSNGYTFAKHEHQGCADVTWLYEEDIDAALSKEQAKET